MNPTAVTKALKAAQTKWGNVAWSENTLTDWALMLEGQAYGDAARAIHQSATRPTLDGFVALCDSYQPEREAAQRIPEPAQAWRGPQLPEFCTPERAFAAFQRGYLEECAHPTTRDRHGIPWPAREPTPGLLERYWETISRWNQQ